MSETELKREDAIRAYAFQEGYKEGYDDALLVQYKFSKSFGDEICKLKAEIRRIQHESWEYRRELIDAQKQLEKKDG